MRRAPPPASPAPAVPRAWADVVARYLEALRLTHYAADTVHIRTLYLKYFTAWATARGLTKPEDVTRAVLERYQRWLYHYRKRTGTPLSVWSQHGRLVAVKGLFRWLTKQRALATNPAAELELPRVTAQRLPQPLTDAAITEGLAHAAPTPGGRAIAWLEKYLGEARPDFVAEPDEGTVFLTRTGRPFHPNHLSRLARDYLVAAGIAKRGACHLLRHTMGTGVSEAGADVRVIQEG